MALIFFPSWFSRQKVCQNILFGWYWLKLEILQLQKSGCSHFPTHLANNYNSAQAELIKFLTLRRPEDLHQYYGDLVEICTLHVCQGNFGNLLAYFVTKCTGICSIWWFCIVILGDNLTGCDWMVAKVALIIPLLPQLWSTWPQSKVKDGHNP